MKKVTKKKVVAKKVTKKACATKAKKCVKKACAATPKPKKAVKKQKCLPTKELKNYKELLMDQKDDVLKQIREISEDTLMKSPKEASGDISGYSIHNADMASDNYERDFSLGLVSSEHEVLMEIDEAMKRVEEKTYGICGCCNKFIAKTRLKAVPHTKNCTKCQETIDQESERR